MKTLSFLQDALKELEEVKSIFLANKVSCRCEEDKKLVPMKDERGETLAHPLDCPLGILEGNVASALVFIEVAIKRLEETNK